MKFKYKSTLKDVLTFYAISDFFLLLGVKYVDF